MLYPYKNKFVLFDEIAPALNGYARIIEFRCFKNGTDNCADPTMEDAKQYNWVMSMTEGELRKGKKHGLCRNIHAYNGLG